MFENPRRDRQARNFTTNVSKILDLKSSSEQIFSKNWRWVPLMVPENWTLSVYQQKWHAIPEISVKAGVNRNPAFVNSCIFAVHPCSADTRGFLEHTHIKHIELTCEVSSGRKSCSPGSDHTHSKLGHLLGPVDGEKLSLLQPEKTADVEPQRPPQTMEKRLRRRSGHHQRDKTRWQTLVRDILVDQRDYPADVGTLDIIPWSFAASERETWTRVKDRAKNGASETAGKGKWVVVGMGGWRKTINWRKNFLSSPPPSRHIHFWPSFHFSRGPNRKSRPSVFLSPEKWPKPKGNAR